MTTPATYSDSVDRLWEIYRPKMEALCERIKAACEADGIPCDYSECSDEEYGFWLTYRLESEPGEDYTEGDMDSHLYLLESACREGSEEGVSFGLTSCFYGGRLGGPTLTPYNYTGDLWVPVSDSDAIAERWEIFEQADLDELVQCLRNP